MTTYDGYEWAMDLCLNRNEDPIEKRFPSKTAAEEWLREHHPGFFRRGIWYGEGETWFQYGTGYYWAQFTLTPKPVASATLAPEGSQGAAPE